MTQAPPVIFKIPTNSPQPGRGKAARLAARAKTGRPATGRVFAKGTGRAATRGGSEVIELEYGIAVYPAREEKGRWRAVWYYLDADRLPGGQGSAWATIERDYRAAGISAQWRDGGDFAQLALGGLGVVPPSVMLVSSGGPTAPGRGLRRSRSAPTAAWRTGTDYRL